MCRPTSITEVVQQDNMLYSSATQTMGRGLMSTFVCCTIRVYGTAFILTFIEKLVTGNILQANEASSIVYEHFSTVRIYSISLQAEGRKK